MFCVTPLLISPCTEFFKQSLHAVALRGLSIGNSKLIGIPGYCKWYQVLVLFNFCSFSADFPPHYVYFFLFLCLPLNVSHNVTILCFIFLSILSYIISASFLCKTMTIVLPVLILFCSKDFLLEVTRGTLHFPEK